MTLGVSRTYNHGAMLAGIGVRSAWARWLLVVALCIAALVMGTDAWAAVRSAWVIPQTARVRKGPGTSHEIVAQASRGTKVFVVKFRDGWAGLKLPSGQWGWIREDLLMFSADKGRQLAAEAAKSNGNSSSSAPASGSNPPVWVSVSAANVRSGPGLGYSRYGTLPSGTKLYVVDRKGEWLRCKTPNGYGWLSSGVVTSDVAEGRKLVGSTPAEQAKAFVNAEVVNLRAGPSTSTAIVARVLEGQTLWVLEKRPQWAKVRVNNGSTGWMMRKYMKSPDTSSSPAPADFPSASSTPSSRFQTLTAWVDGSSVNVREAPGTGRSVKFQLAQGEKVTVVELRDQWCKIKTASGQVGWIAGWVVSFSPPSSNGGSDSDQAKLGWVTRPVINLRSGPGENYPRVGTLELSTQVFILEQRGDWYKVAMDNREIGWVGAWLVDTRGERLARATTSESGSSAGSEAGLTASGEGDSEAGRNLVRTAMKYLGHKYVRGGERPGGFDCSGLVQYVLKQHGISGNRTSPGLFRQGRPVSRDNLEPGDVVFFENTYRSGISHVGIYVGQGRFIHAANPGSGVKITSLDDRYYAARYVGARRMH